MPSARLLAIRHYINLLKVIYNECQFLRAITAIKEDDAQLVGVSGMYKICLKKTPSLAMNVECRVLQYKQGV